MSNQYRKQNLSTGFKAKSCSTLCTKDGYNPFSNLPRTGAHHRTVATDNNKIIIQIKYDDNDNNTKEINHKISYPTQICSSDKSGITRISTGNGTQTIDQPKYNERPIDVPADFEREAYARAITHNKSPLRRKVKPPIRHLNPTLEDFLAVSNTVNQ